MWTKKDPPSELDRECTCVDQELSLFLIDELLVLRNMLRAPSPSCEMSDEVKAGDLESWSYLFL